MYGNEGFKQITTYITRAAYFFRGFYRCVYCYSDFTPTGSAGGRSDNKQDSAEDN
jgi:hypothetical protein